MWERWTDACEPRSVRGAELTATQCGDSAGSCLWSMWRWSVPMDRVHKACPSLIVMKSSQPLPQCILHPLFPVQLPCSKPESLEVAMHCGARHKRLMTSGKVTENFKSWHSGFPLQVMDRGDTNKANKNEWHLKRCARKKQVRLCWECFFCFFLGLELVSYSSGGLISHCTSLRNFKL